jgi:hypothetical protein
MSLYNKAFYDHCGAHLFAILNRNYRTHNTANPSKTVTGFSGNMRFVTTYLYSFEYTSNK